MVRQLFDQIAADRAHVYEVSMQFVQIYLERVYDLLAARPASAPASAPASRARAAAPAADSMGPALAIREDKDRGAHVEGAVTELATTAEEALDLCRRAGSRITFAHTDKNAHSPRPTNRSTLGSTHG
jgi:hypothetical protein